MRLPGLLFILTGVSLIVPGLLQAQAETQAPWFLELEAHERLQKIREKPAMTLSRFTTDGCSGGQSASWNLLASRFPGIAKVHGDNLPWEPCCIDHDRVYHSGGTDPDSHASAAARLVADSELEICVMNIAKDRYQDLADSYDMSPQQVDATYRIIARAMYAAVRAGGAPCTGLSWRWGYGYPGCEWFD